MKEERNKYLVELSQIRIDLCQAERSAEAKIIELDKLKAERDEARQAARFYRDVYVSLDGDVEEVGDSDA